MADFVSSLTGYPVVLLALTLFLVHHTSQFENILLLFHLDCIIAPQALALIAVVLAVDIGDVFLVHPCSSFSSCNSSTDPTPFTHLKNPPLIMKYVLSAKTMSVLVVALFLSTATGLVHQLVEHNHWNELRDGNHKFPPKQKAMPPLIIDTFQYPTQNDLGFWHGSGENLTVEHSPGFVRFTPTDPDQNFHTQFDTHGCFSLWPWENQFLHVVFEGTDKFSVSLNEHNAECDPRRRPFPGVPDTVEAVRYVMRTAVSEDGEPSQRSNSTTRQGKPHSPAWSKTELYIPLSHFHIAQNRVVSVSFHGFYTNESITLHRVEIVPMVPSPSPENEYFRIPSKLPNGRLVFRCSRPGSFAFGIDDGQPQLAQEVMKILDKEDVRVTFFVVGAGLRDPETNFTQVYREMLQKGHQIALHSNTHPKYVHSDPNSP